MCVFFLGKYANSSAVMQCESFQVNPLTSRCVFMWVKFGEVSTDNFVWAGYKNSFIIMNFVLFCKGESREGTGLPVVLLFQTILD